MTDPAAPSVEAIRLVGLRKRFGEVRAVDDIELTIGDGEFFSMLGPSGSGKTTVLRLIAGFEEPDAGAILLHGKDVAHLAPYDRDVNTVFQDYALFPHMTVLENVEYGLMVKRVGKKERRVRAEEMLATVRLADLGGRKPTQLSGGQRQRVALARALVNRPKVLLLDEPLGALDLKLREEMQVELKAIQHSLGITFVFVTHDQGEALSMSDRVAVFNKGRIEQVGTPIEVYQRPETEFVANFVGTSNVLPDGRAVRPERIEVVEDGGAVPPDAATERAEVVDVLYLGAEARVRARVASGAVMIAAVPATRLGSLRAGETVTLAWHPDAALALHRPPTTGEKPNA